MSSCHALSDEEQAIAQKRREEFKRQFTKELLASILPKILLQDDFTGFVDLAYGIDKRDLVVECLRHAADEVATKYTLADIKGGICE